MSMLKTKQPTYKDGRTKQAFKDETDINKILKRAQKTGTISHLNKYEARYGDFTSFEFFDAQLQLSAGRTIFDDLPSEIRNEFNQSPADFFKYVNDPENKERLGELLPALAEPGRQNLNVSGLETADETAALAKSEAENKPAVSDETIGTVEKPAETSVTATDAQPPIAPPGVPE